MQGRRTTDQIQRADAFGRLRGAKQVRIEKERSFLQAGKHIRPDFKGLGLKQEKKSSGHGSNSKSETAFLPEEQHFEHVLQPIAIK